MWGSNNSAIVDDSRQNIEKINVYLSQLREMLKGLSSIDELGRMLSPDEQVVTNNQDNSIEPLLIRSTKNITQYSAVYLNMFCNIGSEILPLAVDAHTKICQYIIGHYSESLRKYKKVQVIIEKFLTNQLTNSISPQNKIAGLDNQQLKTILDNMLELFLKTLITQRQHANTWLGKFKALLGIQNQPLEYVQLVIKSTDTLRTNGGLGILSARNLALIMDFKRFVLEKKIINYDFTDDATKQFVIAKINEINELVKAICRISNPINACRIMGAWHSAIDRVNRGGGQRLDVEESLKIIPRLAPLYFYAPPLPNIDGQNEDQLFETIGVTYRNLLSKCNTPNNHPTLTEVTKFYELVKAVYRVNGLDAVYNLTGELCNFIINAETEQHLNLVELQRILGQVQAIFSNPDTLAEDTVPIVPIEQLIASVERKRADLLAKCRHLNSHPTLGEVIEFNELVQTWYCKNINNEEVCVLLRALHKFIDKTNNNGHIDVTALQKLLNTQQWPLSVSNSSPSLALSMTPESPDTSSIARSLCTILSSPPSEAETTVQHPSFEHLSRRAAP